MRHIRPATSADLPRLLAITNEAIENTAANWSLSPTTLEERTAWFGALAARGYPVLVAEAGGMVAGFASLGDFRPKDGYLTTVEHSIYVHPDAQGCGHGTALLAAIVEAARGLGKHCMIGGIDGDNAGSLALHARFGFTEVGRLPQVGRKFDRWLDLVLMQKML